MFSLVTILYLSCSNLATVVSPQIPEVLVTVRPQEPLTRDEIIAIAAKKGYYETGKEWNEPVVKENTESGCWIIECTKYTTTRRGKCKHTNGCTIAHHKMIRIDRFTGKILERHQERKKFPNYE